MNVDADSVGFVERSKRNYTIQIETTSQLDFPNAIFVDYFDLVPIRTNY